MGFSLSVRVWQDGNVSGSGSGSGCECECECGRLSDSWQWQAFIAYESSEGN